MAFVIPQSSAGFRVKYEPLVLFRRIPDDLGEIGRMKTMKYQGDPGANHSSSEWRPHEHLIRHNGMRP